MPDRAGGYGQAVVPKDAEGLLVQGTWDSLCRCGTTSRDLVLKDVFATEDDLMMPKGIFIKTLPHWPHRMATQSPTHSRIAP